MTIIDQPVSELIRNERGAWLLTLPALDSPPGDDAALVIDPAHRTALLQRGDMRVRLPGLHGPAVRELARAGTLLIAEYFLDDDQGRIAWSYEAVIGAGDVA